jgi:hypothetical protein
VSLRRIATVWLGAAVSLATPALLVIGVPDALVLLALVALFAVGLALEVQAGLVALRARVHPLWSVIATGGCYFAGASIGSMVGFSAAFSVLASVNVSIALGVEFLPRMWTIAGVSGAVVAAVITCAHAVRSRA